MQQEVENLVLYYSNKWRDKPDVYWLSRLVQEVGELSASLTDNHGDSPDHELRQIASIALNWLEYRSNRKDIGLQ